VGHLNFLWRTIMGEKSKTLFEKAKRCIPGGVNSPVRAGKAVGIDPPFIARAEGCYLWDVEGTRYIDYVCSWGPLILGHSHPEVVKALEERLPQGTSYGAPTELEVEMAETIVDMVPSIEMVRMVNSGTEATMSAIRLARGFSGKDKIIKFEGCYHGHGDCLLVSAGSGVATFAIPGCPGVPSDFAEHTISLSFNDLDQVEEAFEKFGEEIAAVIVEPIPGNMGVVLPKKEFLSGLREITQKNGALLIFDEVISGFRVSPGGAQELYGIMPDLTCLGKIIGGGLPVGAYGGRRDVMERMVEQKGNLLFSGLAAAAISAGVKLVINRIGSMGSIFFTENPVTDFASAKGSGSKSFNNYYLSMLNQGIYLAPSAFEACFVSTAHDEESIQKTIDCASKSFRSL
jgi:glutamate-1-semialdehyde 2,1-aminomutase